MNNMNPYYQQPQMSVPYGVPYQNYVAQQRPTMQSPKMVQPLTSEEIGKIKNNNTSFTIAVDQQDIMRSICTHKSNNSFDITDNCDGTVTCNICGETFRPVNAESIDVITKITDDMVDVLQTIKLLYTDVSPEMAREYYPIIPLIKKIPKLYSIAQSNFTKYVNPSPVVSPMMNNQANAFNMLGNITSGAYGNVNYNPMGYPMYPQQPQAYQQPMYDPSVQGVNPMNIAGNVSQGAATLSQNVPAYNPFQQQPQAYQQPVMQQAYQPQMAMNTSVPANYGFVQPQANIPSYAGAPNPNIPVAPETKAPEVTVTSELKV